MNAFKSIVASFVLGAGVLGGAAQSDAEIHLHPVWDAPTLVQYRPYYNPNPYYHTVVITVQGITPDVLNARVQDRETFGFVPVGPVYTEYRPYGIIFLQRMAR
jgi:hypothetical protein